MVQAEGKYLDLPQGEITARNYSERAQQHCAVRTKSRDGLHPTLSKNAPEFMEWWEYFDRHLGKIPVAFQMFLDGKAKGFTVPEERPEWFDPSFHPTPGWRPSPSRSRQQTVGGRMSIANVLVRKENARYREMCDRARTAESYEFLHDQHGIWVAEKWLHG